MENSIIWHRTNSQTSKLNSPHGNEYQRYNYVINNAGKIIVAVWKPKDSDVTVDMNAVSVVCTHPIQKVSDKFPNPTAVMVNFYSEEPLVDEHKTKLSEDTAVGIKVVDGRNILDQLTKHFMLAQGLAGNKGITSASFHDGWRTSVVAYAGEIIVDIKACQYTINSGSGTYAPDPSYLEAVAVRFGHFLGINPPVYEEFGGHRKFVDDNKAKLKKTWCT